MLAIRLATSLVAGQRYKLHEDVIQFIHSPQLLLELVLSFLALFLISAIKSDSRNKVQGYTLNVYVYFGSAHRRTGDSGEGHRHTSFTNATRDNMIRFNIRVLLPLTFSLLVSCALI